VNGIHDLGGLENLGPVVYEHDEPVFHHEWERRVFAGAVAVLGARYANLDEVRRATEWMPPAEYLQAGYFETWLYSLTALLVEKGLITRSELEGGDARQTTAPPSPPLAPELAAVLMNNPIPTRLNVAQVPKFKPGDQIRTRNINPTKHTRLPRYARDKQGTIEQLHGAFLLPDTNAHGGPADPHHLYSVCFSAKEIWGSDASARDAIHIDLFEPYLETPTAITDP